jgi:hypothetical protein
VAETVTRGLAHYRQAGEKPDAGPFYAKKSSHSSSGAWATATADEKHYTVTITDDSGISRVMAIVADILP